MIVNESDTLELNCRSARSATLSWFKKENTGITRIVPNSRISITFQDVNVEGESMTYSILAIRDVIVSDGGIYVCEAQNDDSANHTVHINGKVRYV